MPEKHAILSPSSAYRWLNCTPSARLAEQFPDTVSEYAAAGTLAHSIAELKARKHFLEMDMSTRSYKRNGYISRISQNAFHVLLKPAFCGA